MSNYKITYSNELYHFGIKGQKWGQRRFQNDDGSLTAAGRERYGYKIKMAAKKSISSTGEKIKSATSKVKNWMNDPVNKEKMKKAAIVGAGIAATALAAYGAYKISERNAGALEDQFKEYRNKGAQYLEYMMDVDRKAFNDNNEALSSYRSFENRYAKNERDTLKKMDRNIYNRIKGNTSNKNSRHVLEGGVQGLYKYKDGRSAMMRNYGYERPGDLGLRDRKLNNLASYESYENFLKELKKQEKR